MFWFFSPLFTRSALLQFRDSGGGGFICLLENKVKCCQRWAVVYALVQVEHCVCVLGVLLPSRRTAGLEDHDGLVPCVKVQESFGLVRAQRPKVFPDDNVPAWPPCGVEVLLDLLGHLQPVLFKVREF